MNFGDRVGGAPEGIKAPTHYSEELQETTKSLVVLRTQDEACFRGTNSPRR